MSDPRFLTDEYHESVARWERGSLVCLGGSAALLLVLAAGSMHLKLADVVAYMIVLAVSFHLTEGMDPMERTGRLILVAVGLMFLFRAATFWITGVRQVLLRELIRVGAHWGFPTFMVVWTALVSRVRPPGQYVYNVMFVSTFSMAIGQVAGNLFGVGRPTLLEGAFQSAVEGFVAGAAFAYITVGRYVEIEESGDSQA